MQLYDWMPSRKNRKGTYQTAYCQLVFLVLWIGLGVCGISSTTLAQTTITVTTLNDRADSPFDNDSPCPGSGTVSNLPGADGLVSLREAIIAANHTAGVKSITFAPSLSGGTISVNFDDLDNNTAPDQLPALCGSDTTINGDLNGDNTPDITIDGSGFTFVGDAISADGLSLFSSRNTVNGLRIQNFPEGGVVIASFNTSAPADANVLSHSLIRNTKIGVAVQAGTVLTPFIAGAVTNTRISANNILNNTAVGIDVFTNGAPSSVISGTTISQNQVTNNPNTGIVLQTNGPTFPLGAASTITQTSITDNTVTQNGVGVNIFPFRGDNYTLTDSLIARNTLSKNTLAISLVGGSQANSSTVSALIENNTITENANAGKSSGIYVGSGFSSSSSNHLNVIVSKNTLKNNDGHAITVVGGQQNSSNNTDNVVEVSNNLIEDTTIDGILALGGFESSTAQPTDTSAGNIVNLTVNKNTIRRSGRNGISLSGGGSTTSTPADNNQILATVTDNTVEQSTNVGIILLGGTTGGANNNRVTAKVRRNTACNNALNDIYAVGGFLGFDSLPPNAGTGNQATGDIQDNIATNILVENGIAGNTASFSASSNLACGTACAANASTQVSVKRGGFRFDNLRRRYVQQLTLINTSGSAISGPFAIALDNLSPTAKLYNATGTTSCAEPTSPLIDVNTGDGILAVGEQAIVILEFTNPSNRPITYTTRVLAGIRR